MCGSLSIASSTDRSPGLSRSTFRRGRALGIVLLASIPGLLFSVQPVGAIEIPEPEDGYWAPSALALLDHHRQLCDGIADKVVAHWQPLGDAEGVERKIQDWVTDHSLSDLAAGREAGDIIGGLLPRARAETDTETAAALERLHELTNELCDTVALPLGPLEAFDGQISDLLGKIDREEDELGRLLVVPDDVLEQALAPYLKPIQLAAFEAEAEYLDYLESLRPEPEGPTHRDLMVAWHQRYTTASQPTKNALRDYLVARQDNDVRGMAAACREISSEVIPLLKRDILFEIPIPQLPASKGYKMELFDSLYQGYRQIRNIATHCLAGRSRETVEALQAMQEELGEAANYLSKFSLQP